MERDEQAGGDAYVDAQIPGALYDRLEALFRDYRGYEPSSVQECLSVVCDLAERDRRAPAGAGRDGAASAPASSGVAAAEPARERPVGTDAPADGDPVPADDPTESDPVAEDATTELVDAIDAVFPTDWSSTDTTERLLPILVKQYVAESDADTRAERENAALSSLAAREGTTPEDLRRTLVDDIYGGSALPGDLATEFFSEALEKVERRIDDPEPETLSPSDLVADDPSVEPSGEPVGEPADGDDSATVGLDLGPGSADLPAELADEMASDGGAVQSVDERVDTLFTGPNGLTEIGLESMVAGARADCEICGASKSIQSLETTTEASDDRRVDLVCSDCL